MQIEQMRFEAKNYSDTANSALSMNDALDGDCSDRPANRQSLTPTHGAPATGRTIDMTLRNLRRMMMKTLVNAICAVSLLTAASAASAHTPRFHPNRANDLQAISPSVASRLEETSPPSFGTGEDSRDSASGGPAGGLIDRN